MFDQQNKLALDLILEAEQTGQSYLDLSGLGLWVLPPDIGKLDQINDLNLSNNNLFNLPFEINELSRLRFLDLSYNNFNHLEFDYVRLSGLIDINLLCNQFFYIPDCCLSLPFIQNIEIGGNPLMNRVPLEIMDDGFWAVADFLESTKKLSETKRIFAAKLLLVGNGEVGKTTLMKSLVNPNFAMDLGKEQTTHGITIKKWSLNCHFEAIEPYYNEYEDYEDYEIKYVDYEIESNEDDFEEGDEFLETEFYVRRSVDLNVWDFGGQAIYHSTHQFFLTARSIYLLIWDPRKNEYQVSLEYWLNAIKQLSNNSPVIVVMNKSDIRIQHIDEDQLKQTFNNIHAFLRVSCLTLEGIQKLREEIEKVISNLPHIGDRLPSSWISVKDDLSSRANENYISLSDYFAICRTYKLTQTKAEFLSNYLHDLGIILHFKNDKLLTDTVILNPEWVTAAVYALIDAKEIQKSNGRFEFSQLDSYWHKSLYPRDKHHELIRLMEKFELCFNILGTYDYIIPELLPPSYNPERVKHYPALQFRYEYRFMPSGVFTRLICRVYNLLQPNKYSKTRAIIKYENSEADIIYDLANKELQILLFGEEASELLGILKNHIQQINVSLNLKEGIDIHEKIACNCEECIESKSPYFFKFEVLRKYKLKGKSTIECHNSAISVDISSLARGYSRRNSSQNLLNSLILAASQLQGIALKIDKDEDSRNSFIASILVAQGVMAKEQARYGKSATGKQLGELDIKIEEPSGLPLSVFEGFNLKHLDRTVIENHLIKIFGYDPNGLKRNYIMVYSEAPNFHKLWNNYLKFIPLISFKYPLHSSIKDKSLEYNLGTGLRIAQTVHERDGKRTDLFHIFVNLKVL